MNDYEINGDVRTVHEFGDGRRYVVGDALDVLAEFEDEAAAVFLDDGWTRPQGIDHLDMNYDAHPFGESDADDADPSHVTTTAILDACYDALADGGWLVASAEDYRDDHAEDWVLPRLVEYLRREWGDVAQNYEGEGFRKVGGVTFLDGDEPDLDTPGAHLSSGGYPVVFAHKGRSECDSAVSARQVAERPQEGYGWNSVKPISPYQRWVEALVEPGELVLVPCAGTAPAAIAAERVFGDDARYVCIDKEAGAYEAFRRRREAQVEEA